MHSSCSDQGVMVARIEALQAQLRVFRRRASAALAIVLAIAALLFISLQSEIVVAEESSSVANSIRTKRLELLDEKGGIRAILMAEGNRTALSLNDSNGKSRLVLNVSSDGTASVSHYSKSGAIAFSSATSDGGTPVVTYYDPSGSGKGRMMMGIMGGDPTIVIGDKQGNGRLLFTFRDNTSTGLIQLSSAEQDSLLQVSVLEGKEPLIVLGGKNDNGYLSMGIDDRLPFMRYGSDKPKSVFEWTILTDSAAELICRDKDEKILTKLPN